MIPGCLSACSPCNHQKRDPSSICDVCQRSHDLTAETARTQAITSAKHLLERSGYTVLSKGER